MSEPTRVILMLLTMLGMWVSGFLAGAARERRYFRRWPLGAPGRLEHPPSDVELTGAQR